MCKLSVLILWTALSLSNANAADAVESLDPTVVSPDMYTVLFENEHVRVVEYKIGPGERDNWHAHPPKVSYVVEAGRLQITTAAGESFAVGEERGSVRWLGTVGRHFGENIGERPVRIMFVEVKGADEQPQDLGSYLREEQGNK